MNRFVLFAAGLVLALGACTASPPPPPPAGPGLMLATATSGWDDGQLIGPRVLRGKDGTWRLWYSGQDRNFATGTDQPWGRIGLATSADGLHWERVVGPGTLGSVMEPTVDPDRFDTGHIAVGSVVEEDGRFVLWYAGGRPGDLKLAGRRHAGLPLRALRAVSRDGVSWQRDWGAYAGALVDVGPPGTNDASMIAWPQVVEMAPGRFHLYYSALDTGGIGRIHLALSRDGRNFAKAGVVFGPGEPGRFDSAGVTAGQVLRRGDQWLLVYEGIDANGRSSIGIASSPDGRQFERRPGVLADGAVLGPGSEPETWDHGGVGTPWLVPAGDGKLHLYYTGTSGGKAGRFGRRAPPRSQLGVALSTGDLRRFERLPPGG